MTEEIPEGKRQTENKENVVEEVKEGGPKEMTLDGWKAFQIKTEQK